VAIFSQISSTSFSRHDKERPGKELDYLQQVDHFQLSLQTLHFILDEFSGSCFFRGAETGKKGAQIMPIFQNYAHLLKLKFLSFEKG